MRRRIGKSNNNNYFLIIKNDDERKLILSEGDIDGVCVREILQRERGGKSNINLEERTKEKREEGIFRTFDFYKLEIPVALYLFISFRKSDSFV